LGREVDGRSFTRVVYLAPGGGFVLLCSSFDIHTPLL
jgi:hypothetical protein